LENISTKLYFAPVLLATPCNASINLPSPEPAALPSDGMGNAGFQSLSLFSSQLMSLLLHIHCI
jgi:hypothetical protein